ncbi:methyl-accepting chemotaxis protein [Spirochaeta dissipatitropha]
MYISRKITWIQILFTVSFLAAATLLAASAITDSLYRQKTAMAHDAGSAVRRYTLNQITRQQGIQMSEQDAGILRDQAIDLAGKVWTASPSSSQEQRLDMFIQEFDNHSSVENGRALFSTLRDIENEAVSRGEKYQTILTITALLILLSGTISGFLFIVYASRKTRSRIRRVYTDLSSCVQQPKSLTLPQGKLDELDMFILKISKKLNIFRQKAYENRQSLDTVEALNIEIEDLKNTYNESAGHLEKLSNSYLKDLSANRILLKSAEDASGVLQLKSRRLIEQTDTRASFMSDNSEQLDSSARKLHQLLEEQTRITTLCSGLVDDLQSSESLVIEENDYITSIEQDIANVMEILNSIHSISEQTRQLSLNAYIESAHGGESNKGFETVASEIRQLADYTSENTDTMYSLIHKIINNVREAGFYSDKASHNFTRALKTADKAAKVLNTINSALQTSKNTSSRFHDLYEDNKAGMADCSELCRQIADNTNDSSNMLKEFQTGVESNRNQIEKIQHAIETENLV